MRVDQAVETTERAGGLRLLLRGVGVAVVGGPLLLLVGTVAMVLGPDLLFRLDTPALAAWRTVFAAIVVQGLPFLLFGTLISAAISAFVPASTLNRLLPRRPLLAVPVAGAAGAVLPGCECASVPVAGSLMRRGVAPAAALTFLLSAPAVNPVVLVATAVAFPGNPQMVLGRLIASLLVAVITGWLWIGLGKQEWLRLPKGVDREDARKWAAFRDGLQHDFLHAGGFLIVGAMAAATFNVAAPPALLESLSGNPWLSVLALAGLAVLLAVCSEADAFVAASLTGFSPTARLAFMVVGPVVDVKLIALQAGTFGRAFALRFSAATFVVAVLSSFVVGWWLL
ncbi:permease [Streptomyces xantholiticus]|uniref:permease n=1 Tax=Streptomyces xantholiticus TaxID=68285 RepID=UPI001678BA46|nr:permease [Streptomyces xantholiticus]GGW65791.1 permease [Streptomyces xantholiticus]